MRSRFSPLVLGVLFLSGGVSGLFAKASCAALFGDHMVLQRELPVPVWGDATPGEAVTVEFAGQTQSAVADTAGHWRVTLAPLAASAESRELRVSASNTLVFSDVLVGEVWFCSGQSNMEKHFGPRKGQRPVDNQDLEVATSQLPLLRLFQIPRTDLPQSGPGKFHWLPCSPDALRLSDFSAAACYFGRTLQPILGVPVGLIHASFGGTRIEAWMPRTAFAAPPLAGLDQERYSAWVKGVQPTELYASMVAPCAPFALRGFLWYQGEANCLDGNIALYAEKQSALIAAWRAAWHLPAASFYGVLLAPFDYSRWEKFSVTAEALPAFRLEQIKALTAPQTGYVVTTDLVADLHDIHPTNKRDIGLRLARLALAETYGIPGFPAHGPTFSGVHADGASLSLAFNHADGLRARDGAPLSDFVIAGEDRVFHPAQAKIAAGQIVVSSPAVPRPVAARFAWDEAARPNLVNAAGLPAVPFRTDDWPLNYLRAVTASASAPPKR